MAFDGCTKTSDTPVSGDQPGFYIGSLKAAQVVCCSLDGSSCSRKASSICRSGDGKAQKYTWYEANEHCKAEGKRLCNSRDELNKCCGGGCNYDSELVWSGVIEGKK